MASSLKDQQPLPYQAIIKFCQAEFDNEYKYFLGGGPRSAEVSIESLYVEAKGATTETSFNEKESFSLMEQLSTQINNDRNYIYSYVILGPSGSGKSSLALHLTKCAWDHFNACVYTNVIIPIYISLPKFRGSLDKILATYFQGVATTQYLTKFCRNNRILLILDSYDEIHGQESLTNLWNQNDWGGKDYEGVSMITFSRPEVFTCISDLKYKFDATLCKGTALNVQDSNCLHIMYYLQKYTQQDIDQYIRQFSKFITKLRIGVNWTDYGYWTSILRVIGELGWENIETEYQEWFKQLADLKQLSTNPYLLYLILQSLPKMIQKYQNKSRNEQKLKFICSTKAGVYDEFTDQWFNYQVDRTQTKFKLPETLSADGLGINRASLLGYFYAYAQNLACSLINRCTGLLTDKPISVHNSLVWHLAEPYRNDSLLCLYRTHEIHKSLFPTSTHNHDRADAKRRIRNLELLRNGCLIQFQIHSNDSGGFRFIHRSLVEYFAARQYFETLHSQYDSIVGGIEMQYRNEVQNRQIEGANDALESESTPAKLEMQAPEAEVVKCEALLNRQLIKENGVLAQLVDRVKSDIRFSELLGEIVLQSAEILLLGVMSANAITILNLAGISFSGQDFRNIQVQGADLSGSMLGNTDLRGANLENTRLQASYLCSARLEGANLRDVDIGQKPHIQLSALVCDIIPFTSQNQSYIWVATMNGAISLWNLELVTKTLEIKHKFKACTDGENCKTHLHIQLCPVSNNKFVSHTDCSSEINIWGIESGKHLVSFNKNDYMHEEVVSAISISCDTGSDLIVLYKRGLRKDVEILKLINHEERTGASKKQSFDIVPHFTIKFGTDICEIRNCCFHPTRPSRLVVLCLKEGSAPGEYDEELEAKRTITTFVLEYAMRFGNPKAKDIASKKLERQKQTVRRINKFVVEIYDLTVERNPISSFAISSGNKPKDQLVVHPLGDCFIVNLYRGAHIYDMLGGRVDTISTEVSDMVFSADGRYLLTGGFEGFMIRSFPELSLIQKIYTSRYFETKRFPIVFTLNHKWIAHGVDNTVKLTKVSESVIVGKNRPNLSSTYANDVIIRQVFVSPNSLYMILLYSFENSSRIISMENEIPLVNFDVSLIGRILNLVWISNDYVLTVGTDLTCISKINDGDYTNYITSIFQPSCLPEAVVSTACINESKHLVGLEVLSLKSAKMYRKIEIYTYRIKHDNNKDILLFELPQCKLIYQFDIDDLSAVDNMIS